ncbi:F-box/RNI-like/FBD-like domains-containing protein, partial [Striga asiatica]
MDESKKSKPPIDRLSSLPDGVICNILSFFPTKTSVSTSVLARRWRNLWAHVPVLYFAEIDFRGASDISGVVNDVLVAHKSPTIDTFRIYLTDMCDDDDFEDWMVTVVARKVRNLDVYLETSLPQIIFSCETLVDLSLGSCHIPDSGDVSLPALRKLKLELVSYESYKSLPNLLSGCPVLEELDIDMGYGENHSNDCDVASLTLKRLSISCGSTDEDHDVSEDYIFEALPCESMLDTPALRFLQLYHVSPPEVTARALASLTEAKVDFDLGLQRGPSSRSVLEFVGKLCGVRSLTLTTGEEPELNMTKYLLRNSKVLKSLKIKPRSQQPRLKGKFEELNKVLLERGYDAKGLHLATNVTPLRDPLPLQLPPRAACTVRRLHCNSDISNAFVFSSKGYLGIGYDDANPCKSMLDTPALRFLQLYSVSPPEVTDRALASLTEAKVDFSRRSSGFSNCIQVGPSSRSVLEFVGKFCCVRRLTLTTGFEPEFNMTKYILRNSKVLEGFTILPRSQKPHSIGKIEELYKVVLERGFDASEINFHSTTVPPLEQKIGRRRRVKFSMDESKKSKPPIDRLSSLPDGVICNILSFLPTKTSVSTSVLARRWRNLWAHVPVLYFAEIDFRGVSDISGVVNDAVNDVLVAHKSPTIDTFRIYLSDMCDYDDFEDWMVTVVDRKVRNLDVYLETSLPQIIFSCETLVDLSLGSCHIPDSGDVSLPALRKLKLELVSYESYKSLPNLLSGCPVLEELDIDMGYGENHSNDCDVASLTLKRLSISCGSTEDHDVSEDYIFEALPCESMLDTPALRFLQLYHVSPPEVTARALASLTEAKVDFDLGLQRGPSSRSVLEFVGKLCGVRSLTLTTGVEPELNMTKYLLRNSKVLESLDIQPRSEQPRLKGKFEELN